MCTQSITGGWQGHDRGLRSLGVSPVKQIPATGAQLLPCLLVDRGVVASIVPAGDEVLIKGVADYVLTTLAIATRHHADSARAADLGRP